jgi:hypothetical protein
MLLLESYARNYWKMQSKYLTDKPATRKLVELLVRRKDKFSRQVLVEMMQLREEETTKNNIDDLVKEGTKIAEELGKAIRHFLDKGEKYRFESQVDDKKVPIFIARDSDSTYMIKKILEYNKRFDEIRKEIKDKGQTIPDVLKNVSQSKDKVKYNIVVSLQELDPSKETNTKSELSRLFMFFGVNFKLLWEKLISKYKLGLVGAIILGLVLIAFLTIRNKGPENPIKKIIVNTLRVALAGFALFSLVVLIQSLHDTLSTDKSQYAIFGLK